MLIGFILGVPILWLVGVIVVLIGIVLWLMGTMAHGGRPTPLLLVVGKSSTSRLDQSDGCQLGRRRSLLTNRCLAPRWAILR
jgi:hypothetical protein